MQSYIIKILKNAIVGDEKGKGPLADNKAAVNILRWILSPIGTDNATLIAFLKAKSPDSISDVVKGLKSEIETVSDLKLKALYLSNARQYDPKEDNQFFKLNLSIDDNPVSCIYHGRNGSGKSTLFASLEYLLLGHTNLGAYHGHDSKKYLETIGSTSEPIVIGQTKSAYFAIEKSSGISGIEASFCSEYDVYEITSRWNDAQSLYVEKQLGINQLVALRKILDLIYRGSEKARNLTILRKNLKDLKNNASMSKPHKDDIKKDLELKRKQNNEKAKVIMSELSIINLHIGDLALPDESHIQLKKVIEYLDGVLYNCLSSFCNRLNTIVPKMMQKHLLPGEVEGFDINLVGNNRIDVSLKINRSSIERGSKTPSGYFNTFRLKLFCVAFKLALFCSAQEIHHINMPFIVDDIFDSSDFNNRSRINEFIEELVESYNSVIDSDLYPLQLIFFTQDTLIGENVYKGLRHAMKPGTRIKYARIFRPSEEKSDDSDRIECELEGYGKVKAVVIEDIIYE